METPGLKPFSPAKPVADTKQLIELAGQLYADVSLLRRWRMTLRPRICPFDRIVSLVPPASQVLDIGCGQGLLLGFLAARRRLRNGVGVDVDRGAILAAREMSRSPLVARSKSKLTFFTLEDFRSQNRKRFSVVTAIDIFHHVPVPEREGLLREIAAWIEPGGLLLYKDVAQKPFWRKWWNRIHDFIMTRERIREMPLDYAKTCAVAAGLRLSREEKLVCGVLYGHDLLVFSKPGQIGGDVAPRSAGPV